jgi:mono/diheme cytochrome c family protein
MIARGSLILAASALLAGVLVAAVAGMPRSAAAGSPDRGKAVYFGPGGCAGCHSVSTDPTEPSTGPELTLGRLQADAASAGEPLGQFVAESILVPGAFTAPGYVSGVMQPARGLTAKQIEDLVSYVIGKPWTSPASGSLRLPAKPVAACLANSSCRAAVAKWAKLERLPASALDGARIVAVSGCLSCHRYAGSGTASGSAPDLTTVGTKGLTVAALVKRLRCPTCVQGGSAMPAYAAYGDANLRRVAEFLRGSRGVTR